VRSMSEQGWRDALSNTGWLSKVSGEFRDALLSVCSWRTYQSGQWLYIAGDRGGGIFGVADGELGITTILGPPNSPHLHVGSAGFWTGEAPLIANKPRIASAIAVTDTVVAYAPLLKLQTLLGAKPEWWQHIAQLSLETTLLAAGAWADLMIHDARRRCVAVLLRLAGRRFNDQDHKGNGGVNVSQDMLAAMSNLSRSTVHATLSELAARNLVDVGFRSIRVLDANALRALVNAE